MTKELTVLDVLERRAALVEQWLDDEAPYARFDQSHLDAGTPERAYWHLGYLAALRDAAARLTDCIGDSTDSESHSPGDAPGD